MIINDFFESDFNKRPKLNEVDPHRFDSDEDYYAAKNAPPKRRSAPSDYPYSQEEDDAYFREIFRKKREAAAKAAQDKDQGVAEGSGGDWYAMALKRHPQLKQVDREKVIDALNDAYEDYLFDYGYEGIGPDEEISLIDYAVKRLKQGVAEANKKKEDDVRDVSLQRAITKAKGAFPTASSGIEALTKDLLQSQDQDRQDFEKIRAVDQEQERMLAQIAQVDQNQTQEIDSLEKDNSTLKRRLQQMQAVNARLEKTLASMSGRKKEKTKQPDVDAGTPTVSVGVPDTSATKTKTKNKDKAQPKTPTTSKAIGQVAKSLAGPSTSPAMDRIAKELQPRQKELGFDEPVTLKPKKFDTSRATDVVGRDIAKNVKQNIQQYGSKLAGANPTGSDTDALRNLAGQEELPLENKEPKPERPEADYGDEYQSMVKRVAQKAKQGPRKTVWDPVKRVYKTVPVNS